jgi:hypothetical protein
VREGPEGGRMGKNGGKGESEGEMERGTQREERMEGVRKEGAPSSLQCNSWKEFLSSSLSHCWAMFQTPASGQGQHLQVSYSHSKLRLEDGAQAAGSEAQAAQRLSLPGPGRPLVADKPKQQWLSGCRPPRLKMMCRRPGVTSQGIAITETVAHL